MVKVKNAKEYVTELLTKFEEQNAKSLLIVMDPVPTAPIIIGCCAGFVVGFATAAIISNRKAKRTNATK